MELVPGFQEHTKVAALLLLKQCLLTISRFYFTIILLSSTILHEGQQLTFGVAGILEVITFFLDVEGKLMTGESNKVQEYQTSLMSH